MISTYNLSRLSNVISTDIVFSLNRYCSNIEISHLKLQFNPIAAAIATILARFYPIDSMGPIDYSYITIFGKKDPYFYEKIAAA